MEKNWHGLLKILEIQHLDKNGNILWEKHNIHNILHKDGEEYLLRAAFTGGRISTIIPDDYFMGLDNRTDIDEDDEMIDIVGEPQFNGYERQPVSSSGDFTLEFEDNHFVAVGPIVAFRATGGGSWGPVQNMFFTDLADNSGFLISSIALDQTFTVETGESITMRLGVLLRDCVSCPTIELP